MCLFAAARADDAASAPQSCTTVAGGTPPFGYMETTGLTTCAHKNLASMDAFSLSPMSLGDRWYFRVKYKDKPNEIKCETGFIEYTKTIDGKTYYFYSLPEDNKGNLVHFTDTGAYIRNLKYPVFSFIFLDVQLDPEIKFTQFPMKPGDEWNIDSEGSIDILGLVKLKMKTTAKFKVLAEEDLPVDGRLFHVYKVQNLVERGSDGKIFREEDWFAAGVGLIYINTEAYTLELDKYAPGPDDRKRFEELTVPIPAR
jgi:hypothetical protein